MSWPSSYTLLCLIPFLPNLCYPVRVLTSDSAWSPCRAASPVSILCPLSIRPHSCIRLSDIKVSLYHTYTAREASRSARSPRSYTSGTSPPQQPRGQWHCPASPAPPGTQALSLLSRTPSCLYQPCLARPSTYPISACRRPSAAPAMGSSNPVCTSYTVPDRPSRALHTFS